MPRTGALWVSEQGEALLPNGICQLLKRLARRANIEGSIPTVSAIPTLSTPCVREPEQVLEIVGGWENTRDLHPHVGRGGRHRLPPAGESGGSVGKKDVCGKSTPPETAAGETLKCLAQQAWQSSSIGTVSR